LADCFILHSLGKSIHAQQLAHCQQNEQTSTPSVESKRWLQNCAAIRNSLKSEPDEQK